MDSEAPRAPGRPGRPKLGGRKRVIGISIKVNLEENQILEREAERAGLPVATWMREFVLSHSR